MPKLAMVLHLEVYLPYFALETYNINRVDGINIDFYIFLPVSKPTCKYRKANFFNSGLLKPIKF